MDTESHLLFEYDVEEDINSGIKEKKYEDMINDLEKLLP